MNIGRTCINKCKCYCGLLKRSFYKSFWFSCTLGSCHHTLTLIATLDSSCSFFVPLRSRVFCSKLNQSVHYFVRFLSFSVFSTMARSHEITAQPLAMAEAAWGCFQVFRSANGPSFFLPIHGKGGRSWICTSENETCRQSLTLMGRKAKSRKSSRQHGTVKVAPASLEMLQTQGIL